MSEYFYVIDYIEASLWSVAYILIAIVGFVNRNNPRLAMPKVALFANFAWEVASIFELKGAFFSQGGFGRVIWLVTDIFILLAVFSKRRTIDNFRKQVLVWFLPWIGLTVIFALGFEFVDGFITVSSFVIDIEMAIMFWVQRKKFDPSLRIFIALTKLLGDILAAVYCTPLHSSVPFFGAVSLIFNILYFTYAINEYKKNPNINQEFYSNYKLLIKTLRAKRKAQENKNYRHRTYKKKTRKQKTHRNK